MNAYARRAKCLARASHSVARVSDQGPRRSAALKCRATLKSTTWVRVVRDREERDGWSRRVARVGVGTGEDG
jgi:hypothetical protein